MTKHAPATPLPWRTTHPMQIDTQRAIPPHESVRVDGPEVAVALMVHYGEGEAKPVRDAAYIAHACNAYPQLVAALRDVLRDRITQTNLHQMPPAIRQRVESARALLRSLGEDA